MAKRRFKANIDSEEDSDGERTPALPPGDSADSIEEKLNTLLSGIVSKKTLADIKEILEDHERVNAVFVENTTIAVMWNGYSSAPIENILFDSGYFTYRGAFAARTSEEAGVTYGLKAQ